MTMIPRTPPRIARGASAIMNRAKGSFSSPAGRRGGGVGAAGGSSSAITREANKSPAVSFATDENHNATNDNNGGGDGIIRDIIGDAPVHSGTTLENYVLPRNLRMDVVDEYANGGMEVIKVSKVCRWLSLHMNLSLASQNAFSCNQHHLIHLFMSNSCVR